MICIRQQPDSGSCFDSHFAELRAPAQQPGFGYRIAGYEVTSDAPLDGLAAFATGAASLPPPTSPLPEASPSEKTLFDDAAWVGRETRQVECRWSKAGYRLRIAGVGSYSLSPDGEEILQEWLEPEAPPIVAQETLLGPPLILALALQDTFCLHASGVVRQGQMIAIAGESGSGKSTLAAYLSQPGQPGWQHAADDILPTTLTEGSLVARPRFPQLKLPRQPGLDVPEELPLAALYTLEHPLDEDQPVQAERLSHKAASLALLRFTVASLLFDPGLLQKHLAFCAQVAREVPVYQLVYPHRSESLAQVLAILEE